MEAWLAGGRLLLLPCFLLLLPHLNPSAQPGPCDICVCRRGGRRGGGEQGRGFSAAPGPGGAPGGAEHGLCVGFCSGLPRHVRQVRGAGLRSGSWELEVFPGWPGLLAVLAPCLPPPAAHERRSNALTRSCMQASVAGRVQARAAGEPAGPGDCRGEAGRLCTGSGEVSAASAWYWRCSGGLGALGWSAHNALLLLVAACRSCLRPDPSSTSCAAAASSTALPARRASLCTASSSELGGSSFWSREACVLNCLCCAFSPFLPFLRCLSFCKGGSMGPFQGSLP